MTDADDLVKGATQALAVAKGEAPAASIWHNGFEYVPRSRITALEAENAMLREALKPFADLGTWLNSRKFSDGSPMDGDFLLFEPYGRKDLKIESNQIRRAAAAMEG